MVNITTNPTLAAAPGGTVTPEILALRQEYAKQLLGQSMSDKTINSPWEGVGNMVEALVGGRMANKAATQTAQLRQQAIQQMADALSGGGGQESPVPGGAVTPAPSSSGSDMFSPGVAAAAIPAATGAPPVVPSATGGAGGNRAMITAAMNPMLPAGMQSILLQQAGLGAPTDAMKEYQLAQRQGFRGSMLDYQTQKSLASRPVTNVDVNTAGETEFSKTYGGAQATTANDIVDAGDKASSNLQKSNLLAHLLPQVATGKAAGAFSTIGAWLQSLGMDPAAIGIDPKLPATAEAVNGLANEMILGKIGKGQFPANNFSEQDRNFLLTTIPQLSDRPEAATIKLEVSRRLDNLAIHRADEWEKVANDQNDTRPLNVKFAEFSRDWRDYLQKQDIFAGLDDQLKAIGPAAAAPATPEGGAQPGGVPVGTIQEGRGGIKYRFGGGSPTDRNSWVPVDAAPAAAPASPPVAAVPPNLRPLVNPTPAMLNSPMRARLPGQP